MNMEERIIIFGSIIIFKSLYGYGSYSAARCDEMEKMINLYKKKNLYHDQLDYVNVLKID